VFRNLADVTLAPWVAVPGPPTDPSLTKGSGQADLTTWSADPSRLAALLVAWTARLFAPLAAFQPGAWPPWLASLIWPGPRASGGSRSTPGSGCSATRDQWRRWARYHPAW